MSRAEELLRAAGELGLSCALMPEGQALVYVAEVLRRYRPRSISEHLAIGGDTVSVPLEEPEFSYAQHLGPGPAFVFFEQEEGDQDRRRVVVVQDGRSLGELFGNTYGMEYFVSDAAMGFLLAVNWYVIEGTGSARTWLLQLQR